MVDLFFAHFCWYLLPVFRIFWELLDGGPGGPVCRYLSPLPAHLALPKLSRRTSFPLFQGKWEQRTELRVVSQNHTLCPPRRTFCQVFVAFLKPFLRAFGKIPLPRRKMKSLPYIYYHIFRVILLSRKNKSLLFFPEKEWRWGQKKISALFPGAEGGFYLRPFLKNKLSKISISIIWGYEHGVPLKLCKAKWW